MSETFESVFEDFGEVKYIIYMTLGIAILLIFRSICLDFSTFPIPFIADFFISLAKGCLDVATMAADLLIDVTIIIITIITARTAFPVIIYLYRFFITGIKIILERMKEPQDEH